MLLFSFIGMDQAWTVPLGLALVALFLAAAWILFGRLALRESPRGRPGRVLPGRDARRRAR
jgi:hypothetical protein